MWRTSEGMSTDFDLSAKLEELLNAQVGFTKKIGDYTCTFSPDQSNDMTYAVKLVQLKCDETGKFEICDPSTQPIDAAPEGLLPIQSVNNYFI